MLPSNCRRGLSVPCKIEYLVTVGLDADRAGGSQTRGRRVGHRSDEQREREGPLPPAL